MLGAVHAALAALGQPVLQRLTALFADALCIVASLPELAHYPACPDTVVRVGPNFVGDVGVLPQWPDGNGVPVFAYRSPEHADFAAQRGACERAVSNGCARIWCGQHPFRTCADALERRLPQWNP